MSRQQGSRLGPRSSNISNNDRIRSNGESEKNIWSSMLDSVASGKKLPEKNLIILGKYSPRKRFFLVLNGLRRDSRGSKGIY